MLNSTNNNCILQHLKNHKIYKHFFVNKINIHPGDLIKLPDDCFSHSFMNIKGGLTQ